MIRTISLAAVTIVQHTAAAFVHGLDPIRKELERQGRRHRSAQHLSESVHRDMERL